MSIATISQPFDKNGETLMIYIMYPIGVFREGGVESGGETGDYNAS